MYCTYCGTKLPDRAKFCSCCGRRLDDVYSGNDNTEPSDAESMHSGGISHAGTASGSGRSAVKPVFVMLGLAAVLLLFSAVLIITV